MRKKLRFDHDPLPPRFEFIEQLGRGAMGVVYRARDLELGREVAVKCLHDEAWSEDTGERYRREARELERVRHPNVVGFYGHGTHEGREYLVLEYVAGGDMRSYLGQPREPCELLLLFLGLARGLAELHARGLIHRDLKPENVLIGADGQARLTDLGLVKAVSSGSRQTSHGALVGTFSYLAPEQIVSGTASPASDLYALGCCLHEAFAGRPVFAGRTEFELLERHVRAQPELPPGLPPRLESLILRLLSKQPEDRPSLEEVSRTLTACLDEAPRPAEVESPPPAPPAAPPSEPGSNTAGFQMMLASKLELEGRRPEALSAYRRAYRLAEEGSEQQRELRIILEELERPAPHPPRRRAPVALVLVLMGALAAASWAGWMRRPGKLVLKGEPGAAVRLNDEARGTLDDQGALELSSLPPGAYRLEITLPGHRITGPEQVELSPGAVLPLRYEATPIAVPLELALEPADAKLEVDGKPSQAPLSLPPGPHRLRVSRDGFEPAEREVVLEEGKPQKLVVKLERTTLVLQLLPSPLPARLTLMESKSGKILEERVVREAPQGDFRLPPGRYRVRVRRQGYQPLAREITLEPGLAPVKLAMQPTPPPPPPPPPAPAYEPPPYVPPPVYYPPPPAPSGGGSRQWNTK